MAKEKQWPKVEYKYDSNFERTLEIISHQNGEREFKDLRERPDFTYEMLCKAVGEHNADFIFRDEDGELLFEEDYETIEVLGQVRKNFRFKQFPNMEKLKKWCMYAEEESAKGTIKSFKTHIITAFINYNFHYLQTSASAQIIKLINKWVEQFYDDLKIMRDVIGIDLRPWFYSNSSFQNSIKITNLFYLNYPAEHPAREYHNKSIKLGVLKDPNGWTNITPFFGTKGMYVYHANEEPVRVKTTNKDESEVLDHLLVEANEGILLNNIYRSAMDNSYPFIVHSTFNANTTKNIRVKRNTDLFPHPTDWMIKDPKTNHTMIKTFPTEKKGLGVKILRQSKLSSPVLRNPDANGNTLALDLLADRILNDQLEEQEKLTVLGIPFDMVDPSLNQTYTNPFPNLISFDKFIEEISEPKIKIVAVDAGVDEDPAEEFIFHISCLVKNQADGELKLYRIANMSSKSEIQDTYNKFEKSIFQQEWLEEQIIKFAELPIIPEDYFSKRVYIDDNLFGIQKQLIHNEVIQEYINKGVIETKRAPKVNGWYKDDLNPRNKKMKEYYHASIINRVEFENNKNTIPHIVYIEEYTRELREEEQQIMSSYNEKEGMWMRIETHNRYPLNRKNGQEYAESRIREEFTFERDRPVKKRYIKENGGIGYESMR